MNFLAAGAFAAVLALPLCAYAQQDQAPAQHSRATTTPNQQRIQNHWAKRFGHLNLSGDQQQRIQSLINQFSQAHPEGSPRDRSASRELRRQIMGVLSDDQRNQYHQEMRARREQSQQRQGQNQDMQGPGDGQYNQGPQQQQGPYDQGPPPNQGPYNQGPPPNQGPYNQGPPPNQGPYNQGPYNQGPPPNQGPPNQGPYNQGPPPDQSGPPPA